jgi:hypothetical protein
MGLKRILHKKELFRLKPGCTKVCDENMIPNVGFPFVIFSPFSKTEYKTEVKEYSDWEIISRYILEGNCYK